jgi:hypothetical protein
MGKISKIKSVQGAGTWNGKDGTLYYKYDYVMEDGEHFNGSHLTPDKFSVGEEVEYEITSVHQTYGKNAKLSKPGSSNAPFKGGGGKKGGSNKAFALSYAKDLAIAYINKGVDFTPEQIVENAKVFDNYLES